MVAFPVLAIYGSLGIERLIVCDNGSKSHHDLSCIN